MIDWSYLLVLLSVCSLLLMIGNILLLKSERFQDGTLPFEESWPEQLKTRGVARIIAESAVVLIVLMAAGLLLANLVGMSPSLSLVGTGSLGNRLLKLVGLGLGSGILCGMVFEALRVTLFYADLKTWNEDCQFTRWKTFLGAAITAGIIEELIFRMILLSGLVWGLGWVWPDTDGTSNRTAFWTANLVVSLVMAVTHLPIVGSVVSHSRANVFKLLVLITITSLLLGYVFWTFGFEVAALCHGTALLFSWWATAVFNWFQRSNEHLDAA